MRSWIQRCDGLKRRVWQTIAVRPARSLCSDDVDGAGQGVGHWDLDEYVSARVEHLDCLAGVQWRRCRQQHRINRRVLESLGQIKANPADPVAVGEVANCSAVHAKQPTNLYLVNAR